MVKTPGSAVKSARWSTMRLSSSWEGEEGERGGRETQARASGDKYVCVKSGPRLGRTVLCAFQLVVEALDPDPHTYAMFVSLRVCVCVCV